jgi:hypothetical protein
MSGAGQGRRSDLPAYPATVLAAVRAAEVDGRLRSPAADVLGDVFPFEPDVTVVAVDEPVLPEPDRPGELASDCRACAREDAGYDWVNARWRMFNLARHEPLGVHAFMLQPREHLDLDGLGDELAAEQGRLTVALERAVRAGIDGVGRVHVYRWGDGGAHLHWWFLARPAGLLQLRGSQLATWLDVLPPLPAETVSSDTERVVAELSRLVN